jgi:hypothetical protein
MSTPDEADDDEPWRFALDEVGPEAEEQEVRPPIEPGSPSLENALFVLLGVLLTVALLFSVINP